MFRPVSLFIGWRYVRSVQDAKMITLYAFISILGLALGVAVLIVVLSILNGFEKEFKQRILGLVAPVKIYAYGDWPQWREEFDALKAAITPNSRTIDSAAAGAEEMYYAPFIELPGMLVKGRKTETLYLSAIDPALESTVSPIAQHLDEKHQIGAKLQQQPNGLILGRSVAEQLGVEVGDQIKVLLAVHANSGAQTAISKTVPKSVVMPVVSIITTKTELDRQLGILHLHYAQTLLNFQGVMGVKIRYGGVMQAPQLAQEIRHYLRQSISGHRYTVIDWSQTHGNLYQAIKLPQTIMWLLLVFILVVAAFNMTTTLFMMVRQKRQELAVLQTFGASSAQISGSFLAQGSIVAVMGIGGGAILGTLLALSLPTLVMWFESLTGQVLFQGESYFIQFLPVEVSPMNVVMIIACAFLIAWFAVLWPAFKATRLEPVDALRGES